MDSSPAHNASAWLLGLLLCWLCAVPAGARAPIVIREPYVELHSGPGRGYPAIYALERGDQAEVLERQYDWLKLRTVRGEGWARRAAMTESLAAAGIDPDRRSEFVQRYLAGRAEFGVSAGSFEKDPLIGLYLGYRLLPAVSLELHAAEVSGTFSNSRLYRADLVLRPRAALPIKPHLSLGLGRMDNSPRATLLESRSDDATLWAVGIGASTLLGDHLLLRADWRYQRADFADHEEFQEFSAGFALRF